MNPDNITVFIVEPQDPMPIQDDIGSSQERKGELVLVQEPVLVPILEPVLMQEHDPMPIFNISICEYVFCGLCCITCGPILYISYVINLAFVTFFRYICRRVRTAPSFNET